MTQDGTQGAVSPRALHESAVVVDAHHDIILDVLHRRQQGARAVLANHWAPLLRQGGVDVQVFPIFVSSSYLPEMALRRALQMVEAFHADLEEDSSLIALATSYATMEDILATKRIAGFLALEGCECLGSDLSLLGVFYRLGVRVVSLTWNRRTMFADGIAETATGGGLTSLGFAAIREMNRLRMLIDVSHLAERGFFDVLRATQQTVIASHSNARAICNHPRNLTDEQIRALADNGGVMGLLISPAIIDPQQPTLSRAVDHIAYIADLVGIEHVGLGIDLVEGVIGDPAGYTPQEILVSADALCATVTGLESLESLVNLTSEMMRRGFSPGEIECVLGKNFLRVFKKVLL